MWTINNFVLNHRTKGTFRVKVLLLSKMEHAKKIQIIMQKCNKILVSQFRLRNS